MFCFKQYKYKLEFSKNLTIATRQRFSCSEKTKFQRYYNKQENLKTLSRNKILTPIKGHDILTNKPEITPNNSHIDLVNMNAFILFGEFLSLCSQDVEREQIFGVNKGP